MTARPPTYPLIFVTPKKIVFLDDSDDFRQKKLVQKNKNKFKNLDVGFRGEPNSILTSRKKKNKIYSCKKVNDTILDNNINKINPELSLTAF